VIPVAPQPEPADFDTKVRIPGQAFVKAHPHPTDWKDHWRKCLGDLTTAYKRICAYSAHWISPGEGVASVDHFIPKSKKGIGPKKAYEWDNFRLASLRMNARKGDHEDVLDPFKITNETFAIDFATLRPEPGPKVSQSLTRKVDATIRRLKLDDNVCVESRADWLRLYCDKDLTLQGLRKRAPFLAYEIRRQGLPPKKLRKIFRFPKGTSP